MKLTRRDRRRIRRLFRDLINMIPANVDCMIELLKVYLLRDLVEPISRQKPEPWNID